VEASQMWGKVIRGSKLTLCNLHRFFLGVSNDGCGHGGRKGEKDTLGASGRVAKEPCQLFVADQVPVTNSYYKAYIISPNQDCKISTPHFM